MFLSIILTVLVCYLSFTLSVEHTKLATGFEEFTPLPFQPPTPGTISSNVLALSCEAKNSKCSAFLNALKRDYRTTPLSLVGSGQGTLVNVTFGDQNVFLKLSTATSDTWIVQEVFQCVNPLTSSDALDSSCGFGPAFEPTKSPTFERIADENFQMHYGRGDSVRGYFGYENITLGGFTVKHQQVAVVDYAAWRGDNSSSGILGLAYPPLTRAYRGTDYSNDDDSNRVKYDPIFTTIHKSGFVPAKFSIAICRGDHSGGYLTLGGLPPGTPPKPKLVSTPIEVLKTDIPKYNYTDYSFYTVTVNEFLVSGPSALNSKDMISEQHQKSWLNLANLTDFQMIVDSGTTTLNLPTTIAKDINASFDPPAVYSEKIQAYRVSCNATAPEIGVRIAGHVFPVNPSDLIYTDTDGTCFSGVNDAGSGLNVLGLVFHRNAIVVYDVGAAEMQFATSEEFSVQGC
ncbi:hypothetical protein VTN00DRAFT_10147 [Thermoascus crustaceus]|uniref:uncharacterized protein n=1 Tax=Thermoascus crustaceus TaxID=5088 RepID=UPI0037436938